MCAFRLCRTHDQPPPVFLARVNPTGILRITKRCKRNYCWWSHRAVSFSVDESGNSRLASWARISAPRVSAQPRRSTWQGRRFARPLHPTRAGGVSLPPCTPRRGAFLPLDPDHIHGGQPCADWMRGNGVARCIASQASLAPPTPPASGFRARHHDESVPPLDT